MISVLVDVFEVPAAEGVILTNRETPSEYRTLILNNLTSSDMNLKIEESVDGTAWTTVGVVFTLAVSESAVKQITSLNMIRVKASGTSEDGKDLLITLLRTQIDATHVWPNVVL